MWETETWRPTQRVLHSRSDIIERAIVSPDSQMLACVSEGGTIKVWKKETDTWKVKWEFMSESPEIPWELSFSSNSLLLAANKHTWIGIWNLETGEMHRTISQSGGVFAINFSQDIRFLFGSFINGTIGVWETQNWSLKQEVKIAYPDNYPSYYLMIHAFSPDNKYIACSRDNLLTVIESKTWTMFQTMKGHTGSISAVTFSSDNKLMASGGSDHTIRLWDIVDTVPGTSADDLDKHRTPSYSPGFLFP